MAKRTRTPVRIPSFAETAAERERLARQGRFSTTLRSTVAILVVIAAAAILAATLLLSVLQVSGSSMEPALEDGDVAVVLKTSTPSAGDLIAFYYQNKLLLKRVVACPGDVVSIADDGTVSVNGTALEEPYVSTLDAGSTDQTWPIQVPEGCYFVLGDSREISLDSRQTAIGCISSEQILGRILLRLYPSFGTL